MSVIDELIEIFRRFPGVGPRQAERFVYYLLRQDKNYLNKIATLLPSLSDRVKICSDCYRFHISDNESKICKICLDRNRNKKNLIIVSRDVDLQSIEKSGTFDGTYFVLGGSIPILDKNPSSKVRLKELKETVIKHSDEDGLEEIILALNANPEGENTANIIKKELKDFVSKNGIRVSVLGRGLSTGTELEYSDSETIKNALKNRF